MGNTDQDQHIIADHYESYKQTQAEIFSIQAGKTRNSIFWIAGLLFGSSMLSLAMTDLVTSQNTMYALVFPVLFVALALLAIKQPMLAVILSMLLYAGIIFMSIWAYGGRGALSGLIVKAVIIYFLLAGFQSAKIAEQAKKEM